MQYAICTVPAAPVRKEDSHRAEMTNQLLFGETMAILEEKGEWLMVRTLYDNYEGWLTHHLITSIDEGHALEEHQFVATSLINPVTLPDQLINLPMGSFLTGFDPETRLLWDHDYKYHGTYRNIHQSPGPDLLLKTVHAWLNAPYLWGGKTLMGVDCSGFVQTVFKVLGVHLWRDAYQQAALGTAVDNIQDAREGDLAFFHNEAGKITHVGIILNERKIIHASGRVRIDTIDRDGIINLENGKRTHHLNSLRRLL